MVRYFYKAKSIGGEEKEGVLEADNERQLAQDLKSQGFFLVSAERVGKDTKQRPAWKRILAKVRAVFSVSFKEKLFLTRNLEVMIRTGVPLSRAIRVIARQTRSKKLKQVLEQVADQIIKGRSLSEALSDFPAIFPPIYTETLKIGEETGQIEDSLKMLSEQMEKTYDLRSKIKTAMTYPMVVLSVTVLIGVLMIVLIVPQLREVFQELDIALPVTTRTILGATELITHYWLIAVFVLAGLLGGVFVLLRSEKTKKLRSKLALHLPVAGKIVRQTNSALVLRTLTALLRAGIPIVKSLEISAGSLRNYYFQQSLNKAAKVVEKGEKLSQALKPHKGIYSPLVLEMMAVGEETGETTQILEKLADFYEAEVSSATEKLSSIIEPILILIIGAGVGFFAVSMMQPMFSIMSGM